TLVIAAMITFILDPLVNFFMKLRLPRGVASFVVCAMALTMVYLFGVGLYSQASRLVDDLPAYSQRINDLADTTAAKVESIENATYRLIIPKRFQESDREIQEAKQQVTKTRSKTRRRANEPVTPPQPPPIQEVRIKPEPAPLVNYLYTYLRSFYNALLMASFVPFLVYFMLSWRDHIGRGFLYLLNSAERQIAGRSWEGVGEMVRAYVIGNFILGLLLAGVSSICFFSIFRLPYAILTGVISGFLSLIPYVGMPLAVIPPLLAALAMYNQPVIYLIIALSVALLHLIALNLLYPKIVGAHVHLNPLVVTIALMFWGTLWGGIGLILAIPITAGVKAVCDNVESLNPYSRLLGD
ncbi:MAG: AI-2E family transporter, partial [Bryobacteraceae bacterium]